MIRVTMELISARGPEHNELLGVAEIANDGTGTATRGNYNIKLSKRGGGAVWKEGYLPGFALKRLLAWDLLILALGVTLGPERMNLYRMGE